MKFEFATAGRIVFGPGTLKELKAAARSMGRRALLVTGRNAERATLAQRALGECVVFPVEGEPSIDQVRQGVGRALAEGCDLVVSVGGGSAIDAGKAIAALIGNGGDPLDYIEVIGRGLPLAKPSAPFIAVATTAGTGSEVTRNAVLASPEHKLKASLRSPHMLPRLAIVDPELTLGLPAAVTAATGLDALTQLIEPFTSARANPMTDLFAIEGMKRAARSLIQAYENGSDLAAREDMCFASLMGGLCLANAGLGAAHGFAAPVGGAFEAPHGAVCAALLPQVMEANLNALRWRAPSSPVIDRYTETARILTGRQAARAMDGIAWVRAVQERLHIPPLRAYGITPLDVESLAAKAAEASSMKANPIVLTGQELRETLERSL